MFYQTQMPFIFVIFYSDIGQCFRPAQTNSLKNQKVGLVVHFGTFFGSPKNSGFHRSDEKGKNYPKTSNFPTIEAKYTRDMIEFSYLIIK